MTRPNFTNRTLYHGDNLTFLRGINSGTVHLIYADPPFNKNKDFHATPDSIAAGAKFADRWRWDTDVHPEWVDAIQDDWPGVWQVIEAARVASGEDMAAFLCWLGVRLLEMRRVLRNDGSLYLHIDHNTPRSQGGLNHIGNRLFLCGAYNDARSDTRTFTGFRQLNAQSGRMAR